MLNEPTQDFVDGAARFAGPYHADVQFREGRRVRRHRIRQAGTVDDLVPDLRNDLIGGPAALRLARLFKALPSGMPRQQVAELRS